jgi:predicted transcriptional regulator
MEERAYRQSRLCRVLGNPLAFSIVRLLVENKDITPSQIARGVGRSVSRVSHVLAALRMMEVVRYETNGKQASYRLKHPRQIRQIISALEQFVDSASPSK